MGVIKVVFEEAESSVMTLMTFLKMLCSLGLMVVVVCKFLSFLTFSTILEGVNVLVRSMYIGCALYCYIS